MHIPQACKRCKHTRAIHSSIAIQLSARRHCSFLTDKYEPGNDLLDQFCCWGDRVDGTRSQGILLAGAFPSGGAGCAWLLPTARF